MSEADWTHLENIIWGIGGLIFCMWLFMSGKL